METEYMKQWLKQGIVYHFFIGVFYSTITVIALDNEPRIGYLLTSALTIHFALFMLALKKIHDNIDTQEHYYKVK